MSAPSDRRTSQHRHSNEALVIVNCEKRLSYVPTDWGSRAVLCRNVIGRTSWTDTNGQKRTACAKHREELMRRYPSLVSESELRVLGGNR